MTVSIVGIGSVSAQGCGVGSLKTALERSTVPRATRVTLNGGPESMEVPVYKASPDGLDAFVPRRALRRVDRFTRMSLLASFLALEDAAVALEDRSRVGVVFGTGFGPLDTTFRYQDTIIDDGDNGASPTLFANSVHSSLASAVSLFMKIDGPCITLSNFELTTTEVLRTAANWLSRRTVDYVLAGVGDEFCEVAAYALHRTVRCKSDTIDPLDFDRCSYVPGEGFVSFLLAREDSDIRRGRTSLTIHCDSRNGLDKELLKEHRAVFLSAKGDSTCGGRYGEVVPHGRKVAAYSPLYGALPVGLGFDVALAAISCDARRLFPSPARSVDPRLDVLTEASTLCSGDRIACVECSPRHTTVVSVVAGQDGATQ